MLDNLMHLFGGVALVLLVHTLVDVRLLSSVWVTSWRRLFFIVVSVVIGWEMLGVLMLMRIKDGFVVDTASDVLFGILGSITGWIFASQLKKLES